MSRERIQDGLLAFLVAACTVGYLPFSEDPFRSFRESVFIVVAAGLAMLALAYSNEKPRENETGWRNPAAKYPLLLFGVAAAALAFSLYLNGAPQPGITAMADFLLAGTVFASLYAALGRQRHGAWLALFFAAAFANAALGVAQYFGHDPFFESLDPSFHALYRKYAVAGFLDSPNMLAPFLASFTPYLLARSLAAETGAKAAFYGAGLLALLVPVAMTKNLAAAAGLAAVLPLILAYFTVRSVKRKKDFARIAVCWAAALIASFAAQKIHAAEDWETRTIRNYSWDERVVQNRAAMMMFMESPLVGKGPASFYSHFVEYRRAVWFSHPPLRVPDRASHEAHNDYAQLLAEGGLLAAIPLFAIMALWLAAQGKSLVQSLGKPELAPHEAPLAGAAGGFWVIAVNALGNFPFHIATLAVTALFWAALAARMLEYGRMDAPPAVIAFSNGNGTDGTARDGA